MVKLNNEKHPLHSVVFWPAMALLVVFIGFGVFRQEALGNLLNTMLYGMANMFGWLFELLIFLVIIAICIITFSKYGNIRIGGPDAKPDFKRWNWITMSLCGGIGTGLLFWAMGEPIYHFVAPPAEAGAVAMSREAGIFAVSQAMWQWSIPQYALYTICGVAFALLVYNYKAPLSFGPLLDASIGRKSTALRNVVHALSIFTLCGAVACSMGVGLMQIGAGVEALTGLPQSNMIWLIVAAAITFVFTLSSVSGIGNGLKKLASFTTIIFLFMLVYVAILGPSEFMAKIGVESFAEMVTKWPEKTMIMNTLAPGETWCADWIVQYWASFFVYACILGMFLSRLAKGRTVREFVLVNVLAPSIFCIIWIAVFGGMTVQLQTSGAFDVYAAVQEHGMQSTIFHILNQFPLGKVLILVFVVSIFTSFSTMADPIAAALATISVKDLSVDEEAPNILKIVFGIIMGAFAYILVASGGLSSVKGLWVIIGFPISLIVVLMVIGLFKACANLSGKHDYIGNFNDLIHK